MPLDVAVPCPSVKLRVSDDHSHCRTSATEHCAWIGVNIQLLTLMVLAHRKVDNVTDYSTDIRASLEAHNGRPHRTYREAYDATANESGVALLNSLWSVTAQVAMIEARTKRAVAKASRASSAEPDPI